MRIIAGTHRGTQLAAVGAGDDAAHLRPTSDRVRESLFNVLQGGRFGDILRGARVLDLFAGTGALGLKRPAQNLNRGDSHTCDFVIHPVWEDGSCQHLCQTRFGRGFSDTLRKG